MNMRETFVSVTKRLIEEDSRVSLILGGISVASFAEHISKYPQRVFDAGIMEQTDISIAAGLAITGMIPIFHTIAPFLVERAYEQLKIDFGYQKLGGNFISTGASLDYSSFGATHQCPADVPLLSQIPGMQIIVPGTSVEFEKLFLETYANGSPTYTRLCRDMNSVSQDVHFGKATIIQEGKSMTVVAVGPMLDIVKEAVTGIDVTLLYYTTIKPFDAKTMQRYCKNGKILLCEPYYEGAMDYDIISSLNQKVWISHCGIPHQFCKHYGTTKENYLEMGISIEHIRNKAIKLIEEKA